MADSPDSRSSKIVAAVTTLLLIASVIWITGLLGRNARLADTAKTERLNGETMLSEKLLLEKEIAKLHVEQSSQEEAVGELNHQQAVLKGKLQIKEEQIRELSTLREPIDALRRRHNLLEKDKDLLEQKVKYYQTSLQDLEVEHNDAIRTVTLLREQNRGLATELRTAQLQSVNDIRVEALTRRNALTSRARHMRSLFVTATVAGVVEKPAFKIIGPEGKVLSAADGVMGVRIVENDVTSRFASLPMETPSPRKRLEMVFTPKLRLTGGTYTIEVSNEGTLIGSLQTKLR